MPWKTPSSKDVCVRPRRRSRSPVSLARHLRNQHPFEDTPGLRAEALQVDANNCALLDIDQQRRRSKEVGNKLTEQRLMTHQHYLLLILVRTDIVPNVFRF